MLTKANVTAPQILSQVSDLERMIEEELAKLPPEARNPPPEEDEEIAETDDDQMDDD